MSSRQESEYLRLRFVEKQTRNSAAFHAGISWKEGELIDAAVERGELSLPVQHNQIATDETSSPTLGRQNPAEKEPAKGAAEAEYPQPLIAAPTISLGHNSGDTTMADGNVAADELRLFIERIERLTEEKKGIAGDIRDVYAEAKGQGFDVPTMREMVRLRAMEPEKRAERDALIETYRAALGMLDGTPLGNYAMSQAA